VRFGPDNRLFGILSMPAQDRSRRPAVILFNTGAGHHVGPHRLYVPLAREWAANGHVVLRFDLGGIGDSQSPPGDTAGDAAYPTHMLEDAREAIAFVRRHAPVSPVIVAGLCSGAWLAFEAARRGLAVDAVVAVNPPLYLRDGGRQWVREQREADRDRQSLRDPSRWISAARRGTAGAAAGRVVANARRAAACRFRMLLSIDPADGLAGDLHAIARRGIATLFVFGDADNGKRYFDQHARPALRRADVARAIRHVVVTHADHAFRPLRAQRVLRSILDEFVSSLAPLEQPRDG
jgi:alpha-beta hydrolase superfamily lysophospholipase